MSLYVTKRVWAHSEASGNDLAVLLALAWHVNDGRAKEGEAWIAWPSHETLASRCNCSVATVKRALSRLKGAKEVERAGRGPRGVIEWEITLPDDIAQTELPDDDGPAGVAQFVEDLAQFGDEVAQSVPPGSSPVTYKPVGTDKEEPVLEHMSDSKSDVPEGKGSLSSIPSLPAENNNSGWVGGEEVLLPCGAQRADVEEELANWREALPSASGNPKRLASIHQQISKCEAMLEEAVSAA